MAENNTVETPAAVDTPAPQPSIGLQDLQNAVKVIDYACEQGAFKGWSVIEQVSLVRNKLNAFVAASTPKEETEAQAPKKGITKARKGVTPPKTAAASKSSNGSKAK